MEVFERDELIFGPFIVIGEPPLRGLLTGLADGDMPLPSCSEMIKHMDESPKFPESRTFAIQILKLPACPKLSTRTSLINICLFVCVDSFVCVGSYWTEPELSRG